MQPCNSGDNEKKEVLALSEKIAELSRESEVLRGQLIARDGLVADLGSKLTTSSEQVSVIYLKRDKLAINECGSQISQLRQLLSQVDRTRETQQRATTRQIGDVQGLSDRVVALERENKRLTEVIEHNTIDLAQTMTSLRSIDSERDRIQSELDDKASNLAIELSPASCRADRADWILRVGSRVSHPASVRATASY